MTTPSPHVTVNSIPPVTTPDGQLILRGRIKTPADLVSVWWTVFNADWESSRQRAINQSQVDGAQPYSMGNDRRLALGGRTNVNWGFATQAVEDRERPFTDILDTIDVFGQIPTNFGEEAERQVWEPILAQEITRTIRGWDEFYDLWLQNAHLFTMEGLSFAFFEDCRNWKWRIYGQQFLKFPRRVRASVNYLDIITCKVDMMPHELFDKVRNPEVAKQMGWNREAVIEAIRQTASQHGIPGNDPQEWERAWKDNDIMFSTTTTTVETVHGWIREVDGSVSYYIARYDGAGEFLYKSLGMYSAMSRLMIAYKDGVGTNGDFQSIRGIGQKTFASSSALNRVACKFVDMAVHVATPHMTCDNEDVVLENAFRPLGPYIGVTSGMDFMEQKVPPFDQTLIPAMDMLTNIFNNRGGRMAPGLRSSARTQKTATQVDQELDAEGSLTSGQMYLFFVAWGNHFCEIVRRLAQPDYRQDEPGGEEVWELRARLVARGVPLEALYGVDVKSIQINMGVGKGSISERRAVSRNLLDLVYPGADEYGKRVILRMVAIAYAGTRIGSEIVPEQPGLRPEIDETVAELENNDLVENQPVEVFPNQNHAIHVRVHLGRLQMLNSALTEMQMDINEAIPQMFPVWQHANEHLVLMNPQSPETAQYKQALQQLGEVIINGQKHIEAEQRKAEGEAGEQGGEVPSGLLVQAAEANAKLQMLQLNVADRQSQIAFENQKRQMTLQEARQNLVLNDMETAVKIKNENRLTDAKAEAAKVQAQKRGNARKPAKKTK